MKLPLRPILVALVLTLIAGALGGAIGVTYGNRIAGAPPSLDTVIHNELGLTAEQTNRIEALESAFAVRQKELRGEMRAANNDLAEALDKEHTYGPSAKVAIDRFHHAEEALQIATVMHVMAMRAVLNVEQARKFDLAVHQALTAGPM